METLFITKEDARRLKDILEVFEHAAGRSIQKGSLTIDDVTLAWTKVNISLTLKDPPAKDHLGEE